MAVHCRVTFLLISGVLHVEVVRLKFSFNNYNEYSVISRNILCE